MAWLYVPELADSNSDLAWQFPTSEPFVSWRGKPMPLQFWQRAWAKGGWIKLLFGMTSPPSTLDRGAEKWISSLVDTHANHSPSQENEKVSSIHDTFGPTLHESSESVNPYKCSWKMLEDISNSASEKSLRTYDEWTTTLRRACLLRRRWGHRTKECGCMHWPTPDASLGIGFVTVEMDRVSATNKEKTGKRPSGSRIGSSLRWDKRIVFVDSGLVNPTWCEWYLMGWPKDWTALKPLGTESFRLWQRTHTELLRRL